MTQNMSLWIFVWTPIHLSFSLSVTSLTTYNFSLISLVFPANKRVSPFSLNWVTQERLSTKKDYNHISLTQRFWLIWQCHLVLICDLRILQDQDLVPKRCQAKNSNFGLCLRRQYPGFLVNFFLNLKAVKTRFILGKQNNLYIRLTHQDIWHRQSLYLDPIHQV